MRETHQTAHLDLTNQSFSDLKFKTAPEKQDSKSQRMILLLLSERKLHVEAARGERVSVGLLPGGGVSTEGEHGCLQT